MSSLNPNIQLIDLVKGKNIRGCEVFEGNEYIGTFIPYNSYDTVVGSFLRAQADELALKANSVLPVFQEEVVETTLYEKRVAAMAHAREARKTHKELVSV